MSNFQDLTEDELDDFKKHMYRKIMWKDQTRTDDENLSHGAIVTPLRTMSSAHHWIRRNLIPISDNEFIYISGAHLILHDIEDESQKIIKILYNDSLITCLYFEISTRGDRLIIIGEKILPPNCEAENTSYQFKISGRVEIINVDKPEERINLDHSFYVNYESFIYDAIVVKESDYCLSILKNTDTSESETRIFLWDYFNRSLILIHEFEHHIAKICSNKNGRSLFIFYSLQYCALWEYYNPDKKLILRYVYVDDIREVSDAAFIDTKKFKGVIISFSSLYFEIFNNKHELFRSFNIFELYSVMGSRIANIELNINRPNSNNVSSDSPNNASSSFNIVNNTHPSYNKYKPNKAEILEVMESLESEVKLTENSEFDDTKFIPAQEILKESEKIANLTKRELMNDFKLTIENKIKYVICRDNFIFVFFAETKIYYVFELDIIQNEEVSLKINSVNKLNYTVSEYTSIFISNKIKNMTQINGEISRSMFMNKFDKTRKSIYIFTYSKKKGAKGNAIDGLNYTSKNKDVEVVRHKFEKVKIKYFHYKMEVNSSIPQFFLKKEIFQNTACGQEIKNLAVSQNPRLILAGYAKKQINIFQQYNSDNTNSNILSLSNEYSNYENSFLHQNQYLQDHTKVTLINTKIFESHPTSITINSYGNTFFITFEEASYLYTILDKEVKELAKINSCCTSGVFSSSGNLLAFANSDYGMEYNIIIINTNTLDVEYIITRLPCPTKIMWQDNDSKILSLFQDTTTNILGWTIGSSRFMTYNFKDSNKNEKYGSDEVNKRDKNLILKMTDYTEKIVDFAYDHVLDYLVILTEEKVVKVFHANLDDVHWEFPTDYKYCSVLLIKKLDILIFGTSEGSIRIYIWPISNFTPKEIIDPPSFYEKFIHSDKVTLLSVSSDLQYLYTASIDGSIYISSLNGVSYDNQVNPQSFHYFDQRNILPKKVFMNYEDLIYLTDPLYKSKIENIEKRQTDKQTINSEFITEMEKQMSENNKDIQSRRNEMNDKIDKKKKIVKRLEDEKETLTKQFKDKRENQVKVFNDEIGKLKSKYKIEKENLQSQTKNLSSLIKNANLNFEIGINSIEEKRKDENNKIKQNLENMLNQLHDKYNQIEKHIEGKKKNFKVEMETVEKEFENKLREKDSTVKNQIQDYVVEKSKLETDISKTKKDNLNYDQKIKEWELNLIELKNNNADLIESHLFNTLKLKQMNNLLKENEKKISENELEVKKQRTVNDRLEQLRYVLEYQIKNLIKEKTPIEEQIKNFEELHNDFNKRFNLLYAEKLNIDDFITNNENLIEHFKEQLTKQKQVLYNLKHIFTAVDLEINSIFKNKIENKNVIMDRLVDIYNAHLKNYIEDENGNSKETSENKLQAKVIEKEISKQKNKILRDLINKREDRKMVKIEKDYLMKEIRENNQSLIEECSSIRTNLEDILSYITDIEKKFIELTNTHLYLHKSEQTKLIRDNIRAAKRSIMLGDNDKTKIAKGNTKNDSLTKLWENKNSHSPNNRNLDDDSNGNIANKMNIFKKLEDNKEEMIAQNNQIEKMQRKIRDLIGIELGIVKNKNLPTNNNLVTETNIRTNNVIGLNKNLVTQPKTGINNEKLKQSRVITIKSKYFDPSSGGMKDAVNPSDLYSIKKK